MNAPKFTLLLAAAMIASVVPQAAALADTAPAAPAAAPAPAKVEKATFQYVSRQDYLPQRILALPAPRGSDAEALELATVRAVMAGASPERVKQAAWDNDHEDPSLFNAALGIDLTKLPATWSLLMTVQTEADGVTDVAKEAFGRVRPYGIDQTITTCVPTDPAKALRSYPSGHATVGYSVGMALARLLPDFAPYIHDRARDYAYSRLVCGVHFPSDTEASHVVAALKAELNAAMGGMTATQAAPAPTAK
jgi:acid phosphatase (class A)